MWEHSQCDITAWNELHGSIRVNVDIDGADADDDEGEDMASSSSCSEKTLRVTNARS